MLDRFIQYTTINPSGIFMRLFLLFMVYSVIGWIIEVVCCIVEDGKVVNRGFLIGPYCPIHAIGCIAGFILLKKFSYNPFLVFSFAVILVSIFEYVASYVLEKLFHARWWDYSKYKFNLNGRIKLSYCLLFGLALIVVIYIINPLFINIINLIPYQILKPIFVVILVIFVSDCVLSFNIIRNIEPIKSKKIEDNTEEIRNNINKYLNQL